MSTKSRQNGLSSDDRSQIRSAILSSREMLELEFERQLERYGVYDDDRVPLSKLGHLSLQDRETRREIDAALERELEATEDYQRAYRNYIREATKEYLNRYVGLKTIEARGLVTETLTTKAEYGNRSYLHYTVGEIAGELTDTSDDGLGVALDLAFREIGAEIRILFEDTDYTAIEPEFTVRRDVFEELGELDDEAWAADEAIGWVYQYFGEKEREEIDKRIKDENYKVQDTDVATKTQLFTPRYIVEYLVDNSLGRTWLEMHGDETSIDAEDNCFYLTPVEESLTNRKPKDPQEITVLDPACGGGHFLFYAFDILYEMYKERAEVVESEIPREILRNNLYGIDIDPGAVQLAALALYLKAKSIEPDVEIDRINIVSADAILVNGSKKQEAIDQLDTEFERKILETIWEGLENIREWGSLVRIEKQVEQILEEKREAIQKSGQTQFSEEGLITQSSFVTGSGERSWEEMKEQLLSDAQDLASEALTQNNPVDEMFAGEVVKGVELLDVLMGEYDVVVANPPYLGSRKMGDKLKNFTKSAYETYRDLYAPFIQRNIELSKVEGYVAMVTPESFMTQSSYQDIREYIINKTQVIDGAHLSGHSFSMKDRPFTIPFVLRNSNPANFESSRFYRMTHEQDNYNSYEKKIDGLKRITKTLRQNEIDDDVFIVDQSAFTKIGKKPMVYWFGDEILKLFTNHQNVGDFAEVVVGLQTGDDDRFMRCWWEVESVEEDDRYQWIINGENDDEYYESPSKVVLWENEGEQIKDYGGSRPQNEEYYGKSGIIYRKFSKLFTTKIHPKNHIFSQTTRFIYTGDERKDILLTGYMSSSLVRFLVQGLNPSVHFNQGDAERIPIDIDQFGPKVEELTQKGIDIQKDLNSYVETQREFDPSNVTKSPREILREIELRKAAVQVIHGKVDNIIHQTYDLSDQALDRIYRNLPSNLAEYPYLVSESQSTNSDIDAPIESVRIGKEEYEEVADQIKKNSNDDLREISESLEISPLTIAECKYTYDLYTKQERQDTAGKLVSYLLGEALGHWSSLPDTGLDNQGILVFDENFDNNVEAEIENNLKEIFEEPRRAREQIEDMLNKDISSWLRENYFRYYHCKEYRRRGQRNPIYWHLESDDGNFSCFIHYRALSADTLPKLRGQYVDNKIQRLQNRIRNLESELEADESNRKVRSEIEELEIALDDVEEFGHRIDQLIDSKFTPDFEAGIYENLQRIDEFDLLQTDVDKL
ncbi:BREX-1 system adenine-specific DNA-methyltransferase PglX [Halomarina pelagica]|uniref:BREX-1 system adenine-specific DNA-methyltransferase PglX n=1 Tax=Halomarina pelagica TaxID=2961599 RepID=UPI002114DFCA|nr:BREX-1 system adenine-specific DNA-methyltransferase PglX [Halomarina sp. BND7]